MAILRVGPARPYTTIQSGLNALATGGTLLIDPGTYNENISYKPGSVTNITIKCDTGGQHGGSFSAGVIVQGGLAYDAMNDLYYVFFMQGASHATTYTELTDIVIIDDGSGSAAVSGKSYVAVFGANMIVKRVLTKTSRASYMR